MILTYKYRVKDRSARKALRRMAWGVNQTWNYCTAQQRDTQDRYASGAKPRRWASHITLTYLTKGVGRELGIPQETVGETCREFAQKRDAARRAPRFRASSGARRSLGWIPFKGRQCRVEGNSLTLGGKRYRFFGQGRRPAPTEGLKAGCFVEDARGRWYVCFRVEVAESSTDATNAVGIDLGLKSLVTLSDGTKIEAPRHFRAQQDKLAVAQRARNKVRARAIAAKIANCRKDFLHKLTTRIARENAIIAVGDVSSSQLAKTRMAKSVLDAGWSMLRTQLRYKASRHGAVFLNVDEAFTTRTCSCCGSIPDSSPKGMGALGIRAWQCSECGETHDRDVNAARNILKIALSAQRLDGESRSPAARQPDKRDAVLCGGSGRGCG